VQHLLAIGGIGLLAYALRRRLAGERGCRATPSPTVVDEGDSARIRPLTAGPAKLRALSVRRLPG
jgi:hypothetical protein